MPQPPVAERRPQTFERHDVRWSDPYAWLRDPAYPTVDDPAILDYLRAENAYHAAITAPWAGLVDELHAEIKGRIKADEASVPAPDGPYDYYWRYASGAEYRTWYRRPHDDDGPETVLLDERALAEGRAYFRLRSLKMAPDHDRLAYAADEDGSERHVVRVRGVETAADVAPIVNTSGDLAWAADGGSLLYVELNAQLRPFRVRARRLAGGAADGDDPVLFEEADPAFFVKLRQTQSRRYILIQTGTHETDEVWRLDALHPLDPPRIVAPRRTGRRLSVEHQGERLLILTDDAHENFRLVEADVDAGDPAAWRELLAGSNERYWQGLFVAHRHVVLLGRVGGEDAAVVLEGPGRTRALPFDEPMLAIGLGENRAYATSTLRLVVASMKTPRTVLDVDLDSGAQTVRKVQEIPSGYDPERYVTRRLWATAPDGVPVPVSVVHDRDYPLDGGRPLLLYGYGAYGHGVATGFSIARLSLLERGFAYAIAHVRGGDELGQRWYREGRLGYKTNSFTDFIAAAEALIGAGYTKKGRVAAQGASAGGMLMGAVANLRPDLFGCVVAQVPFVDVLNTMLDEDLPLTPIEWPEWGDPITDLEAFRRIMAYSPYDNIEAVPYPPMLVTAGISDPRVTYWEPAKYVARLRATKTDANPLLLKTNMGAGHFGASGRFDALRETAEIYAFILATLGEA